MSQAGDTDSLIKVLPPEVSNKIAAGEVVQRPASVVKELLDNAIDSGADQIAIVLQNAGRTLIQVRDNGCGMAHEDLRLCFKRHATSKLMRVEDLMDIRTLGFRGEAMASIASVSQVTVATKRVEDPNGFEYEVRGGEEIRLDPAAAEDGTTVTVRNLFYNVPARRAFLKTDATEFRHILLVVHQAAIAHPEIMFDLEADGEIIYRLHTRDRESRIAELFGKAYRASLIPVEESTSLVRIHGLISDPQLAKKSRGEQFLFINNRPFMHRHLNYIIQEIYKDWIQENQYPFYALFFEVDPEMVDVNVHPTKQEIKFEDERMISTFTRSVIKKALNDHMRVPVWNPDETPVISPAARLEQGFRETGGSGPENRSIDREDEAGGGTGPGSVFRDFGYRRKPMPGNAADALYGRHGDRERTHDRPEQGMPFRGAEKGEPPDTQPGHGFKTGFWQLHNQFILSQTRNGMFIMDQHAAHKRIVYEKVLSEAESGLPSTQQLLFPLTVNFSASDFSLLKELHPVITRMGFNVQMLSGNSAMILGVPSDIRLDNEQHVLESVLEQYKQMSGNLSLGEKERVALALANRAAIPRVKRLSAEEMESLVDQLFACDDPFQDPLGRPTIKSLSIHEIRAMFR
ncbi:DNA mismatch repair endonuclease MutL [Balneolales bacterium ANBcel1]|nr:DNA mismatch repair endonuclease MutL [Balneolales bacterium ANBcel1]